MPQCPVCGKKLGTLGQHFHREHPQYKWTREIREGATYIHYYCGICGRYVSGFGGLVKHYEEYHEEIKPSGEGMKMEEYKTALVGIVTTYDEAVTRAVQNWKEDIAKAGAVYTAAVADAGTEALEQIKKLREG